jgi:hypothetical protein
VLDGYEFQPPKKVNNMLIVINQIRLGHVVCVSVSDTSSNLDVGDVPADLANDTDTLVAESPTSRLELVSDTDTHTTFVETVTSA